MLIDDGSVRICGGYEQTMNQDCDKYPVSKTKDLFVTLNEGEKLCKLDINHAYQQLVVSPNSGLLLTVKTANGLAWKTLVQDCIRYFSVRDGKMFIQDLFW